MRNFNRSVAFLILLFCLNAIGVIAQQTEQQRVALEQQQRAQETLMRRMEQGRGNQTPLREIPPPYDLRKKDYIQVYLPLYQAVQVPLTPEEQAKITPAKEDFELYKDFLKKSNTGLAKIFPDPKCSSEFVLDLSNPQCAEALSIPGRGAFFSFRVERNFPFPYADIHFEDGDFKVGGKTELGIISKVGDKSLEEIELTSPEVSPLYKFKPAKTEAEIRKQEQQMKKGFAENGFDYSSKVSVEVDQTYVLRTVAFRHVGQYFNDRRTDVLVVFRVVNQDADGALTILWRRLKKDSPQRVVR